MSEIASILNTVFLALIALYVCVHAAQLVVETHSVEAHVSNIPPEFQGFVSLAEYRKAIDFTEETMQVDVANALLGATVVVILTQAGFLNLILASIGTLWNYGMVLQFVLVAFVTFLLTLLDFPLTWWRKFRINERYGYERTPRKVWLARQIRESILGWAFSLPVILAFIVLFTMSSYLWPALASLITVVCLAWRILFYPNYVVGFSRKAKPLDNPVLRQKLAALLVDRHLENVEILTRPCPKGWKDSDAFIARTGRETRLVIFERAFQILEDDEILALTARAIARVTRLHDITRMAVFSVLSISFWFCFAWLTEQPFFYESLGIHPSLAIIHGAASPGLILVIAITVIPVVLYPAVFCIHSFTRMLIYDQDAYAVETVGAAPLIRALVKLHQDYQNILTPNHFYSLANHRRPHISQRISRAYRVAKAYGKAMTTCKKNNLADRTERFNALIRKRLAAMDAKNHAFVHQKLGLLLEAKALRKRSVSFPKSS